MADSHYPLAADYWVPTGEADKYPVRQADLVGAVEIHSETWFGAQIIHPTCELPKKSVEQIQVIRVRPLDDYEVGDEEKARLVAGAGERGGRVVVAYAHTFFVAPVAGSDRFDQPMIANFREVALVDQDSLRRVAALTHDARVYFIRRKLYFRYRLTFSVDEVRRWEATRIANDPNFTGPKPDWAR